MGGEKEGEKEIVGSRLMKGTMLLVTAGLFSRGLGAVYRILLPRILGAEGVGLYHMAYHVYSLVLFLVAPGLPLAMSRLIAMASTRKDYGEVRSILFVGLILLFVLGLLGSAIIFFGAEFIALRLFREPRVAFPLMTIAPALFFVGLLSYFRGFFQGQNEMFPTAASQVIEQIVRLLVMLGLILYILKGPLEGLVAGAALATVCGEAGALLLVFCLFWRRWPFPWSGVEIKKERLGQNLKDIMGHAFPLSLGALVIPLLSTINSSIIPRQLQSLGYSPGEAVNLYGQYSGMAMVLFFFPLVLTSAMAISLVPAVSEAWEEKNYRRISHQTQKAVHLTILTTLPAAAGFVVLGRELCNLLFGYPQAGDILALMAPSILFLGLQLVLAGVLQGMGKIIVPVRNLLLGAVINGVGTYFFTGQIGVLGAGVGTGLGFSVAGILNIISVSRRMGLALNLRQHVLKPFFGSLSMAFVVRISYNLFNAWGVNYITATVFPVFLGIFYYFSFLVYFKGIEAQDIELIPLVGAKLKTWIY